MINEYSLREHLVNTKGENKMLNSISYIDLYKARQWGVMINGMMGPE